MKRLDEYHRRRRSIFSPQSDGLATAGPSGFFLADESVAYLTAEVLQREVHRVERLQTGTADHPIWAIDLDDESVVLRANGRPADVVDFPMVVEAGIARNLAARGIPIAETRCVDLTRQRCGTDFAIENEARGIPLSSLEDDERLLAPQLTQLGGWIARVHASASVEDWGWIAIDPDDPIGNRTAHEPIYRGLTEEWTDFLALHFEEHLGRAVEIRAIDKAEANRIEGWFSRLHGVLANVPAALLHNDLKPANAFTDGRRISAILDWEDALIGDPVFDLAGWATHNPIRRHAAFLHGYFGNRPRPADFDSRFWFYFTRIAIAQAVAQSQTGLASPMGNCIRAGLAELERLTGIRRAA